jgi:hypothetical protein
MTGTTLSRFGDLPGKGQKSDVSVGSVGEERLRHHLQCRCVLPK